MPTYFNPGNILFQEISESKPFVDKSLLIAELNSRIRTPRKYICITRPRRFGKTTTANMLCAYYSKDCSSRALFSDLKIASDPSFEEHLNKYNIIKLTMIRYAKYSGIELDEKILEDVLPEVKKQYPDFKQTSIKQLRKICENIFDQTKVPFIFIIDEWDAVMRKFKNNEKKQEDYIDFLCDLLKDQAYVALVYMTGILPIKKYGGQSALNMFKEYSMQNQGNISKFTGFTEEETKLLCCEYGMDYEKIKLWYDGYNVNGYSIYNPFSVVSAIESHQIISYWSATALYEELKIYIVLNIDGLREKLENLLKGEKLPLDTTSFKNDMTNFDSADDVLTLLLHLGYLTYDFDEKVCWIPNEEVREEFYKCIKNTQGWKPVLKAIKQSEICLKAIWDAGEAALACDTALEAAERAFEAGDSASADAAFAAATEAEKLLTTETATIASILEESHQDNASIIRYHDENSLACVVTHALYTASKDYVIVREMPTGKGYADIALLPLPGKNRPAIVIELKKDIEPSRAIKQIKDRNYPAQLLPFSGEVILVGMSYSTKNGTASYKRHQCNVETLIKE